MRIKSFLYQVSMSVMLALGLYACSSDDDGLYGYLSSDRTIHMSVNLNELYDNAGFEVNADGVKPSEAFKKIMNNCYHTDADMALKLLDMRGINLDNAVMSLEPGDNGQGDGFLVFGISDKDKFASYLHDNGMEAKSEDGVDVYEMGDGMSLVVDGKYGLIVDLHGSASAKVKELKNAAAKNPLKSWQKDALSKSHTLAMVMNVKEVYEVCGKESHANFPSLEQLGSPQGKEAYGVFTSSLSGLEWDGEYRLCDGEGKKLEIDIDYHPLSKSLLGYTDSKDCAVIFAAMPKNFDYGKLLESFGLSKGSTQVASMLNSIYSVMLAFGPLDVSSFNSGEGWTGVAAVECAPGTAGEYFNMLSVLAARTDLPLQKKENEISVSGMYGINASLKVDGDNLVLYVNTPADGEGLFKSSDFGKIGGMIVDLPANSPDTTFLSIPFGIKFNMKADDNGKATSKLKLTDTKGKLLQNVIEFVASRQ